ncbi:hypothetical protein OM076_35605 [Solirubrobacter ginsenosidimutans]|uniref:DUF320 domain-containing protein n=1 Tax=Solirubrobacter ginsenosidimutans TaxID=490573 RepID=A0A9X3N226_9ACTN|nr:hypothetical protein [Solirubrobacter ginsenosidimutans]MDA0165648.1 hypothetical protein [Solirubrobacter ginsenosidimutans]
MMLSRRTLRLAPLAAALALAAGAPAADAALLEEPGGAICDNTIGDQGQGQTGGNDTIVCGSGVNQIAPATSITSAAGPVITGAAGGVVVTSAGNVVIVL